MAITIRERATASDEMETEKKMKKKMKKKKKLRSWAGRWLAMQKI